MKWLYRLLIALAVVAVVLIAVVEVGRRMLASQVVSAQVASRLAKAYGAAVRLDSVNLGMNGSSVEGLRLFPAGSEGTDAKPWVTVADVKTDVTLWDALRGAAMPRKLTLAGASITLHFDRNGQLLTELPKSSGQPSALPNVCIEHSQLTIDQEGRPPLTLTGIDGCLETRDGALVVSGTIDDAAWGQWTINAQWDQQKAEGSATLASSRVVLSQARLEALPFIPAAIWQEVNELEGDTRVHFQLSAHGSSNDIRYNLTLDPIKVRVHIPSIDLRGVLTGGSVIVEPNQVRLRQLVSSTAGGELRGNGDLDFRNEKRTRMQFDVTARHLDLLKLPRGWDLPRAITGNLNGQAKLVLTVANGKVETDGEGHAVIKDAQVAGNPAEPIELTLRPSGKGFKFTSPTASRLWLSDPVAAISRKLLGELSTLLLAQPPAPSPQPSYLELNLGLNNVDLQELARNLQVQLPFAVAGRLSFHLQVSIPTNIPREMKAYRLNGSATLAWFTLEGLRLEQVEARVNYADGVLRLEELKGQVPGTPAASVPTPQQNASGSFAGSARVELFPAREFTAQLKFERLPLDRLASVLPGGAENVAGLFTGSASVRAPVNQLRDLKTWDASGNLQSDRLAVFGVRSESLSARVELRQGEFKVSELTGKIEGGEVSGTAALNVASPYHYEGKLDLQSFDLGMWQRIHPSLRPPVSVAGQLGLKLEASGDLSPFAVHARGSASAGALTVNQITVGNLGFDWDTDRKRLSLSRIDASVYQGKLTGQATVPLLPSEPGAIEVIFQNINLNRLIASLPPMPVRFEGVANGTVKATSPASPREERVWDTDVKMRSPRLKIQGVPAEAVTGTVTYKQHLARYRFQGETLGGTFEIEGNVPVGASSAPNPPPDGSQGRLRFRDLQIDRISAFLGLEKMLAALQGSMDLDLNYRHEGDGLPVGRGSFWINDLSWQNTPFLGDAIPGWLVLEREQVRLGFRVGGLGGATVFRAATHLRQLDRSWFTLMMEHVDLARLLAPWPGWTGSLRGRASLDLRGSLGPTWSSSGVVTLSGATIYGIAVQEARLPIDLSYSRNEQLGQLGIHDSTLRFPTGWGMGNAEWSWGAYNRLNGRMRFSGIDLRHLFDESSLTHYASGQIAGNLDFGGENVRSMGDITATLNATLHHAQALQWPVLRQLTPFLSGLSTATVFDQGQARARLAGGVVRIERFNLQSPLLGLALDGTITVPEGRLNLGVSTSIRPIYLHVAGTYHSPVIQVQPFRFLGR